MVKRAMVLVVGFLLTMGSVSYAESGGSILWSTQKGAKRGGWARFEDTKEGLKIRALVKGLSPGKHGFHIHQYGFCGDKGLKAGDHFNPNGLAHGSIMRDGISHAHAGDLGNIEVGPDGTGKLEIVVPGLTLSGGKYSVGGRSLVVHEKEDNFGQPAGNAGGRIACGTIYLTSHSDWEAKRA